MITITIDGDDDRHDLIVDEISRLYLEHGRNGSRDDTLHLIVATDYGAAELDLGLRKFRPDLEFINLARTSPGVRAVAD